MEDLSHLEERFKAKNTRKKYIPYYVLFLIAIIALILAPSFNLNVTKPILISILLIVLIGLKLTEIHRLYHRFEINPVSVVHTRGILAKRSRRMDLFAISDIFVHQTLFQRILGYGDVHISLFSGDTINKMQGIEDPHYFANLIEKRMREARLLGSNTQENIKLNSSFKESNVLSELGEEI